MSTPPPGLLRYRWANFVLRKLPLNSAFQFKGILFHKLLDGGFEYQLKDGLVFTRASDEDIGVLAKHEEALTPSGIYAERLRHGHACYCLKYKGEILSYNWVAFDKCYRLCGYAGEFAFKSLKQTQAFTYDFYCYKEHRRRGYGIKLKTRLLSELKREGICEVFSLVLQSNNASLRIHMASGFYPESIVYGYHLGPWSRVIYGMPQDSNSLANWAEGLNANLKKGSGQKKMTIESISGTESAGLHFENDRGFFEIGAELLDDKLRTQIIRCVEAQKIAASDVISEFMPQSDALDKVSRPALEELIAEERDVHGISKQSSISNVISFDAKKVNDTIYDASVVALRKAVDAKLGELVKSIFPGEKNLNIVKSGHFLYPPGSHMGWHTNSGVPGWRIYINYCEEAGNSFIRYRDLDSGEIITLDDNRWNVRVFRIESSRLLWHSIYSDTNRFSFGYMVYKQPFKARIKSRLLHLFKVG